MIPVTKPCLDECEVRAAERVIRSGWLTQGPEVAAFERAVADFCGTAHAVAVSTCTAALHLAIEVLDIGPGDEVICPSLSFIATANSIRHAGAKPVFADVDPSTCNLDPNFVEAAITPRTKAILVVHQIGLPADMDRFNELGRRHGVKIVEDAACALGSRYKGRPIGGHSEMACFSFQPRNVLSTGDGGVVTTDNAAYAQRLRLLRQHGMSVSDTVCNNATRVLIEEYVCVGYNDRMTDLQAAIGIEQMKKLDRILTRRRELAATYTAAFRDHPWFSPPFVPAYAEPNFQSYALRLTNPAIDQAELMQRLMNRGITCRHGIMLTHKEKAYAEDNALCLPGSEEASRRSVLIPLYPDLTDAEQRQIIAAFQARAAA